MAADGTSPRAGFNGLAHGRRWTYLRGCRCEPCRTADREYQHTRRTPSAPPEGWTTLQDAAERLGMSEGGVRGLVKRGVLEARKERWRVFVRTPERVAMTFDADTVRATISLEEAAEALQVHERTLRRAVTDGRLRALWRGRVLRFDPADLEAFMESCRVVPTLPPRQPTRADTAPAEPAPVVARRDEAPRPIAAECVSEAGAARQGRGGSF